MLLQAQKGSILIEAVDFTQHECGSCGIPFFVPTKWLKNKINNKGDYTCPNGCMRTFIGKSEAEKVKEQLEKYKQEVQGEKEALTNRLLDVINEKSQLEKKLNRVHNGVCPCCNRAFKDLHRHMKTKHPELLNKK